MSRQDRCHGVDLARGIRTECRPGREDVGSGSATTSATPVPIRLGPDRVGPASRGAARHQEPGAPPTDCAWGRTPRALSRPQAGPTSPAPIRKSAPADEISPVVGDGPAFRASYCFAVSIRPALTAGVAALCAGALTFTATAAPQAASVLTHPERIVSTQVDLRASTELVMPPKLVAAVSALTEGQVLTVANALNPTPNTPVDGVADGIDNLYNTVEPWVRYGFEVAAAVVAWIPWVGIFSNQIMVVYNFVESLINSGVFNTTDWMRGDGSALKNVADWVVDAGLALVWLGIDEVGGYPFSSLQQLLCRTSHRPSLRSENPRPSKAWRGLSAFWRRSAKDWATRVIPDRTGSFVVFHTNPRAAPEMPTFFKFSF